MHNYWGGEPGDTKPYGRGRCIAYTIRRAAADTGRRHTPATSGRYTVHTGKQNTRGYAGPMRAKDTDVGRGGTREGRPRTRRKERGKEGHTSAVLLEAS